MKLFFVLFVMALVLGCGNKEEAEYPDAEEQEAEEQSGPWPGEDTEPSSSSAPEPELAPEEAPAEATTPPPPAGQLPGYVEPSEPSAPRNMGGTTPDKFELMLRVPGGWKVVDETEVSITLRHPQMKGVIKAWLGGEDIPASEYIEKLRQEVIREHGANTSGVDRHESQWNFNYAKSDGTVGWVFVVRFPWVMGPLDVAVFGNFPRAHEPRSFGEMEKLLKSMYINRE